jgi:hydroxymethylbilane synthase
MTVSPIRIGTRGSKLALVQAGEVARLLAAADPGLARPGAVEVKPIRTTGDSVQNRLLAEIGGKGLFTKEIDEALLQGEVELAVHSLKDLPTVLPDGIGLACVLEREDPRDVLIGGTGRLAELAKGASIGTASLRRAAQLLHRRPDLKIVPLRGNVETRIAKIRAGEADATVLALAGLKRLGIAETEVGAVMEPEEMLPAVGQAAIGVTARSDDEATLRLLDRLSHAPSAARVAAERAMLAVLDGSCRTPIAGLASIAQGTLTLKGLVALPDGSELVMASGSGPVAEAAGIGERLGQEIRARAGAKFFRKA